MKPPAALFKLLFLFPLEALFFMVVLVRNFLFDYGLFKIKKAAVPVISVGNLSVGGTGKTPHVAYLIQQFLRIKKRVCVVSRGYGGHYGGYAARVRLDLENAAHLYGDEPVYYAKEFSIPVYVAHERSSAVEKCIADEHPELILSDDSFQHRWMGRSKDIVLLDSNDQNLRLLPVGRLREPLSSLRRAHWVILTKTNFIDEGAKKKWLDLLAQKGFSFEKKNLFLSQYQVKKISLFRGITDVVENSKVFLASAIAQPESFRELLCKKFQIEKQFAYPDHYFWQQKDIDSIESEALKLGITHLLITEKDAVKMDLLVFRFLQVHVVSLSLKIEPPLDIEKLF